MISSTLNLLGRLGTKRSRADVQYHGDEQQNATYAAHHVGYTFVDLNFSWPNRYELGLHKDNCIFIRFRLTKAIVPAYGLRPGIVWLFPPA